MNLAILLGLISVLATSSFSLWMFWTRTKRKYQPGLPLAGGAFLASSIIQSTWVYERLQGMPIPPLIDCMWSVISITLVLSFSLLLKQLATPRA